MRDEDGYAEFVAARWTALHRLAYLLTASRPAAEDLLQTALMKTYVKWARVKGLESPDGYVRKTMVNALISETRRPWRGREAPWHDPPEIPVEPIDSAVLDHAMLWPLICALPARQRAVVVLRYYEDLSEEEIAAALGCARGTVKSQASDALRSLKRGLSAVDAPQPSRIGEP
jgi:RNA polymerase sigma-70 factor (sigma-E family)